MNDTFLIALDMGTTSSKAIVAQLGTRNILARASESYPTIFKSSGIAEQEPDDVLAAAVKVLTQVVDRSNIDAGKVSGISFSGVLQSMIPVDKYGNPLSRAIVWSDRRSLKQSLRLSEELDGAEIRATTGCAIHPMYFPARLMWFKEEAPEILARTYAFISIKEYVLNRLFGEIYTDKSTASGTGIWSMAAMNWDKNLIEHIGLPRRYLPQIVEPTFVFQQGLTPEIARQTGLLSGTPGVIGAADGALAHLGSIGLSEKRMSLSVGTSSALRLKKRAPFIQPENQAWCYYLAENNWLTGGVIHDAGNVLAWFAKNFMGASPKAANVFEVLNQYAAAIDPGAEGLIFFPFMSGEGCPYNRPDIRGAIHGLNFSHTKKHFARAIMEGIAYRIYSVYRMLAGDQCPDLVITGGLLKSPVWIKIISDYLGKKLWFPDETETAAWGAVLVALKALEFVDTLEAVDKFISTSTCHEPDADANITYGRIDQFYRQLYQKVY